MVWLLAKRKRTPKIAADCLMHQAKDKAFFMRGYYLDTRTEDGVLGGRVGWGCGLVVCEHGKRRGYVMMFG